MSTVAPTAMAQLTLTGGNGPVVVTASGDASTLQSLTAGSTIEVVTQSRSAKGTLTVMTADGPLQLKVQPPGSLPSIAEGARLTLQVGNGGSGMPSISLVAINGRPLGGLAGAMTVQQPSLPDFPIPTGNSAPGPVTSGLDLPQASSPAPTMPPAGTGASTPPGLTATVIRPAMPAVPGSGPDGNAPGPAPASSGSGPLPANLAPGTQITVRIAGIEPPPPPRLALSGDGAGPGLTSGPGAMPGSGGNPAAAPTAGPLGASAPAPAVPAGTATPSPAPSGGMAAPTLLSGTVTAHPPGGQAVLTTTIGTLAVPTADTVAVGSRITLEVVAPPTPPTASTTPPPQPGGLTPQGWPSMSESLKVLAAADPPAMELLLRALPQSGPRLAAAMVGFSGALRERDSRAIVNDAVIKALDKAGRADLANRLLSEISTLAEQDGRAVGGGEWRMHSVPFAFGEQIDPIRLFVRATSSDARQRNAGGSGNDQRFILDFHLSNLGRLQLDGLVRREERLFDLIIRTGTALPSEMRMDIMAIFTAASELVGTKGSVAFQAGGRWIEIRTDEPPGPTLIEA